jgi:hypothetical protein
MGFLIPEDSPVVWRGLMVRLRSKTPTLNVWTFFSSHSAPGLHDLFCLFFFRGFLKITHFPGDEGGGAVAVPG